MNEKIIFYKKILIYAGENFSPRKDLIIKFDGHTGEEISYAIKKLDEMGLVEALNLTDSTGIEFRINDITSEGWKVIEKLKNISDKELIKNYDDLSNVVYSKNINPSDFANPQNHSENTLQITIIGGIIVAAIAVFIFTPLKDILLTTPQIKSTKPITSFKNKDSLKSTPISENVIDSNVVNALIQSYRTEEYYNGDLYITLSKLLEYSNEKIPLKLSKKGIAEATLKIVAIGDKIIYYQYEIIPVELVMNLRTYDLKIKIIKNVK